MEMPRCINGKNAVTICCQMDCNYPNPFICAGCQCTILHKKCNFYHWTDFKNKLENKVKQINPKFIQFSHQIEQSIQQSIKMLSKEKEKFKSWNSNFGLPKQTISLLKSIQKNEETKFTGTNIAKMLQDLGQQINLDKYIQEKANKITKQISENLKQIQKILSEIYNQKEEIQNEQINE